jgi:fatty acid desaturase
LEPIIEIPKTGEPSIVGAEPAKTELKSIAFYRQALSQSLSPELFKPRPIRLLWYVGFAFGSIATFLAIVNVPMSWPLKLLLGVFIGFCNGGLGFIDHEISHGSVVKNKTMQHILCFFGSIPYFVSPTFWRYWHNQLHHGKTQQLIRDPDAFPNLKIYKASKFMRFMFPFTPGSGHKRSFAYFFFWFSFHNFVAQTYLRFRNSVFDQLDQKRVTLEFTAQILIAVALLYYAGITNIVWVLLIPLFIQNYMLMSYISTNHNISPLTSENDPLVNSLSVTNHPIFEFFHLNFGYHVEHHIFPTMSCAYTKIVHQELLKQFPETYQVMPKWYAMKKLYSSPRIYKNANELINPETMSTTKIHTLLES